MGRLVPGQGPHSAALLHRRLWGLGTTSGRRQPGAPRQPIPALVPSSADGRSLTLASEVGLGGRDSSGQGPLPAARWRQTPAPLVLPLSGCQDDNRTLRSWGPSQAPAEVVAQACTCHFLELGGPTRPHSGPGSAAPQQAGWASVGRASQEAGRQGQPGPQTTTKWGREPQLGQIWRRHTIKKAAVAACMHARRYWAP